MGFANLQKPELKESLGISSDTSDTCDTQLERLRFLERFDKPRLWFSIVPRSFSLLWYVWYCDSVSAEVRRTYVISYTDLYRAPAPLKL